MFVFTFRISYESQGNEKKNIILFFDKKIQLIDSCCGSINYCFAQCFVDFLLSVKVNIWNIVPINL